MKSTGFAGDSMADMQELSSVFYSRKGRKDILFFLHEIAFCFFFAVLASLQG
jgi:hypothetical protein